MLFLLLSRLMLSRFLLSTTARCWLLLLGRLVIAGLNCPVHQLYSNETARNHWIRYALVVLSLFECKLPIEILVVLSFQLPDELLWSFDLITRKKFIPIWRISVINGIEVSFSEVA